MKIASKYIVFTLCLLLVDSSSFSHQPHAVKYTLKTIVIDAGHGGKDPGCHGATAKEKNVALGIALKLGEIIEKNFPGLKVVYTRKTDVFIELDERAAIANRHKADLFISIHCNSSCYLDKKTKKEVCNYATHGVEAYVMGLNKTDKNLDVAKRENAVVLMEDNYTMRYEGFDPNAPESHILFSLYQNAFLDQSISFASKVDKYAASRANRLSRGVKQEGFLVLWKTSMPSVLIETGYLTNKAEEKFIAGEEGQQILADAIFHAFQEYKDEIEGTISTKNKSIELASASNMVPAKETTGESSPTPELKEEEDQTDEAPLPKENEQPANSKNNELASIANTKPVVSPVINKVSTPKTETPVKKGESKPGSASPPVLPVPAENNKKTEMPVAKEIIPPPATTVDVSPKKGSVVFKIQFAAADKMLNLKRAPYSGYNDLEVEKNEHGIYKFMAGNFTTLEPAITRQNEMRKAGFKGAFVVAYQDGKRITMSEALSLMKK